jgi:hypothetical protein
MTEGIVAEVWRHPVKSLRGEQLSDAFIDQTGMAGDRAYGIVDRATERVLSAKTVPMLLDGAARLDGADAEIELPDGRTVHSTDDDVDALLSGWLGRDVRLETADPGRPRSFEMAVDPEDDESPVVEFPCPPQTFLDAGAAHLLTTAALRAAATHYPGGGWDVRRFRPTFLVDVDGDEFVEDEWIGRTVRVGEAELNVFAPTVRCIMTTLPQSGLPRDLDIVKTVNRAHQSNLGVYAAVRTPGRIAVGDAVTVGDS